MKNQGEQRQPDKSRPQECCEEKQPGAEAPQADGLWPRSGRDRLQDGPSPGAEKMKPPESEEGQQQERGGGCSGGGKVIEGRELGQALHREDVDPQESGRPGFPQGQAKDEEQGGEEGRGGLRDGDAETTREPWLDLTWGLSALATVVLSFLPMALFAWASGAVLKLF